MSHPEGSRDAETTSSNAVHMFRVILCAGLAVVPMESQTPEVAGENPVRVGVVFWNTRISA
jgi:hypothetical protein